MPRGLRRFQESGQSHLDPSASLGMHSTSSAFRRAAQTPHKRLNFGSGLGRPLNASSCYRRQPFFSTAETYYLFVQCLEDMRRRFEMCIYGYVAMPEHVHLLLSEPPPTRLADAIHYLKLSFAKRLRSQRSLEKSAGFWQKRYYDRNVRSYREFVVKLRYLHRNPVKRGLVSNLRGLEVEQLPPLCDSGDWDRRDRIGVDSGRPGTEGARRSASDFLRPGSRPKTGREPGAPGCHPGRSEGLMYH